VVERSDTTGIIPLHGTTLKGLQQSFGKTCWHPFRMPLFPTNTGGIAALDHRLRCFKASGFAGFHIPSARKTSRRFGMFPEA